ncbi:MAG: YCF48-related protein [Bacteroidota bacterium]|nr:YCF48-related protein [Bacteroidota bacterium]MDP4232279.1 YCF48-related protein [Bacteroidota bacterium]MDP4241418.1 YCF48-related protein [Bacteroidota bacterium]MDP4286758.1 YCF48-related protein [Bacteroidota bacterium]
MRNLISLLLITVCIVSGPSSRAQQSWTQTKGPEGGAISAVCVDSINHVFIATKAGGIYESQDSGTHWIPRNAGLSTLYFRDIQASAPDYVFAVSNQEGIFRMKRQESPAWVLLDTTATFASSIATLAITPNGDLFISASSSGILVSHDNGDHFSAAASGIDRKDLPIKFLSAPDSARLYAAAWNGTVYFSSDNGQNWTSIGKHPSMHEVTALLALPSGSVLVGDKTGNVYLDTNGTSWQRVIDSATSLNNGTYNLFFSRVSGHVFCRAVNGLLFRSSDMGLTWTKIIKEIEGGEYFPAAVNKEGVIFAGVDYDGMLRSFDDGEEFEAINNNLIGTYIFSVQVGPDGTTLYANSSERIYRSYDQGQNWNLLSLEIHDLLSAPSFSIDSAGVLYAIDLARVHVSTDSGTTWHQTLAGDTLLQTFTLVSTKDRTFASSYRGLFATQDHGMTWTNVTPTGDSTMVNTVVVGMDGAVYAEMGNGDLFKATNINATTWTQLGKSSNLTLVMKDGRTMFDINNNAAERSSDGGLNWTSLPPVDPVNYHKVFGLFIDKKNQLFLSTDSGIYISKDLGDTWLTSYDGLHGPSTSRIIGAHDVCQDKFGNYYAASNGQGVFLSPATSSAVTWSSLSKTNTLECYPNPVISITKLHFALESSGFVHVQLTDVLGRVVWSTQDQSFSGGEHTMDLNLQDFPSGAYLCSVRHGDANDNLWINVTH